MTELAARVARHGRDNFIIIAVALVVIVFGVLSEGFFSAGSAQILLNQLPTLMVVTVGMIIVMLIGGIDLSVGSVVALSSTLVALLSRFAMKRLPAWRVVMKLMNQPQITPSISKSYQLR